VEETNPSMQKGGIPGRHRKRQESLFLISTKPVPARKKGRKPSFFPWREETGEYKCAIDAGGRGERKSISVDTKSGKARVFKPLSAQLGGMEENTALERTDSGTLRVFRRRGDQGGRWKPERALGGPPAWSARLKGGGKG